MSICARPLRLRQFGTAAREREKAQIVVDTSRLHCFDLETGAGICADVPAGERRLARP